jgi:hypothetical protein
MSEGGFLDDPIPRSAVPEAGAFLGWDDDLSRSRNRARADAKRIPIACADTTLYPTHPQSNLKRYDRVAKGRYDHFKVSADSPLCKIVDENKNAQGVFTCLDAADFAYAM